MTEKRRTILHVDMDAFFASVEQAANPRLRGRPVVVCGVPPERGIVVAASYEARPFGIKAGMPVFQAKALLPSAVFLPVNIPKYVDASLELLRLCLTFTPRVEAYSIDEAFLDLTGTGRTGLAAGAELKRAVNERLGLTASVGAGPNKLLAKLATELGKPDALNEIKAEEVPRLMAGLPVEQCVGIGPETAKALWAGGIMTCGELARFSVGELRRTFGVAVGESLYGICRGWDDSPVIPLGEQPVKSVGHELTLDRGTVDPDRIRAELWRMGEKIGRRLRAGGRLGRRVQLRLCDGGREIVRRTMLPEATDLEEVFLPVAWKLFRNNWDGRPVRGLGLTVADLTDSSVPKQLALFGGDDRGEKLARTLDALREKYGEAVVRRAIEGIASGEVCEPD